MKTNVALIGFMGVGKSVIGAVLAERTGKEFVEVDSLIEQKAGKSAPQIFHDEGEIAFRELEIEVIKQIAGHSNQVIACGGGVALNKINIDRLKQKAVIIWLTASPATIIKRTGLRGDERPVLRGISNRAELRSLLKFRRPFYERAADFKLDTSKLEIEGVVEQIILRAGLQQTPRSMKTKP